MSEKRNTLPQGWEWKKLGDITSKTQNKNPLSEPEKYFTYIDISSIDNSFFEIKEPKYLIGNEAPSRAKKEVEKGDILFATTRPNLKNIAMVEKDFENPIASTGFCILQGDKKIKNKYLFYFLFTKNLTEQVESKIRGAQYPAISDKDLMNCTIPLPPLEEQRRIVGVLDGLFAKIDKSIALLDESIASTSALMPSALNEIFEALRKCEKKKFKDITTKIGSGATPSGGDKSYKESGISLIRSMNVHDNEFRSKNLAFIDDEQAKKLNNVSVQKNDVLLNITGASVARCCIVDSQYLPARVNQHVSIIRLKNDILPHFIQYYLVSPNTKNELLLNFRT